MSRKELKETIGALKRSELSLKVCPNCGSTDVSAMTMTGFITQPNYQCNKCGFQGSLFPEVDLNDMKAEKQKEKG